MVMDAVVERFIEQSPVTVMARLALQSLQIRQKLASLGLIFAFGAPSPTGC